MKDTNVPERDPMPLSSMGDPVGSRTGGGPHDPEFAAAATMITLIAGALAASVVIYAGVGWFLTGEAMAAGFQPTGIPGTVKTALAVAGVALLLIAPVVERKVREGGKGSDPAGALAAFRTSVLVGFALREAAALLGLVIAILTGEILWCYGLCLAALAAMIAAWPSRNKLERFARGAVAPS